MQAALRGLGSAARAPGARRGRASAGAGGIARGREGAPRLHSGLSSPSLSQGSKTVVRGYPEGRRK